MTKLSRDDRCDRLLKVADVADMTGLAVGSIYHLSSQGRIPVIRLSKRCIRFRLCDLQTWLDAMADPPPAQER